jgi:ribosomal protein L11 methyltransferase
MKQQDLFLTLTVPCQEEVQEAVTSYLFDLGASGVIEITSGLQAFFPGETLHVVSAIKNYLIALQSLGHATAPDSVSYEILPNRDWNAEWKKSYKGFAIGEKIFIKPSWEAPPERSYECLIEIDPEMAFGTGTHATTRLCLEFLEQRLKKGAIVLDIGTGTGILAIAAAKFGAASIVAFDVDPIASETARRNAHVNGVANQISIFSGTLATLTPSRPGFDLVLANVNRTEIFKLLPLLEKLLDYDVEVILSGILREEEEIVQKTLQSHHFLVKEYRYGDEWLACRVVKTDSI